MKQLLVGFACVAWAAAGGRLAIAEIVEHPLLTKALKEYRVALETSVRGQRMERFGHAQLLFAQLVDELPHPSADLYVNLGNSALQAEQLGAAIVAYRKALAIEPGHRRARTNLAFARGVLPEWARYQAPEGIIDSLFFWNQLYPRDTVHTWAAMAFLVTALLLAASIRWQQPMLRNLATVPGLCWLVLVSSLAAAALSHRSAEAVMMPSEVTARSADTAAASPRFTAPLPGGTEVTVIEQRQAWTQIRVANNQLAWVPASSLEVLE